MYIKRYTVVALILIALVGGYVHQLITHDTMAIDFFGIHLPQLPIALWVVVPLVVFYVASVTHMAFYSFLGSLKLRKYEKDFEGIVDAIVDAYLGKKDRNHTFKTDRYKLLGSLVDKTTLYPHDDIDPAVSNDKIKDVLKAIKQIKNGEVADLKKYNLPSYNQLAIQNERNRYKTGGITAEGILNHLEKYDDSLAQEVYVDFVKKASLKDIQKYKKSITKDALFVILSRIDAKDAKLEISNEELIELFKSLELTSKDYIEASRISSKHMIPDQRIKLFEVMSNEDDKVMDAYLFTLFDLEMLTPANEILENSQENEYIPFKAYSALRECGKSYDIDMFL